MAKKKCELRKALEEELQAYIDWDGWEKDEWKDWRRDSQRAINKMLDVCIKEVKRTPKNTIKILTKLKD